MRQRLWKTNWSGSLVAGSLLVCGMLVSAGCNGSTYDVVPVNGQVTLDGQPMPETSVMFIPPTGRPASAITDQEGNYEIAYTRDSRGAPPGNYRVEISTAVLLSNPKPSDEKFPAKYNTKTELEIEVKNEPLLADFHLDSD